MMGILYFIFYNSRSGYIIVIGIVIMIVTVVCGGLEVGVSRWAWVVGGFCNFNGYKMG